jgi:hypothetical protein
MLPSRAAYLIKAGSQSGFRRAIQEASTRWGGMTEPIIPVLANARIASWWRQVVTFSNVDALVNVDVAEADAQVIAKRLGLPLVPLAFIDDQSPTCFSTNPTFLQRDGSNGNGIIARSSGALWEIVSAGDLTDEHASVLRSEQLSVPRAQMPDQIAKAVITGETFLDQTVTSFTECFSQNSPGQMPTILWITKPNDLKDCIFFWNLRALRSLSPQQPMLLLPDNEIEQWIGFERFVAASFTRPDEFAPDVILGSLGVKDSRLHQVASTLGLEPSRRELQTGFSWPAAMRVPPLDYVTNAAIDVRQFFAYQRRYGKITETEGHIFSGVTTLRFPSPVRFLNVGRTFLQLRGSPFEGLPQRAEVACSITQNAIWRDSGIQINTNAMSSDYLVNIRIPTLRDALDMVLRTCTTSYELSDKGLLAMGMSANVNPSVLLEPNVYEAICELRTPRSKELLQELKRQKGLGAASVELYDLAGGWGGRQERRYRSASQIDLPNKVAIAALEKLCSIGWAERGVAIKCQRCGVESFIQLGNVTDAALCPGCRSGQVYKIDPENLNPSGLTIFYRLNTLVDRACDQGVLPHILVNEVLKRRNEHTCLLPGVDVKFESFKDAEVDLIGSYGGKILTSEVKVDSKQFTPTQIRHDLLISKRLTADVHVMAAMNHIPKETISFAQRIADRTGIELLVMTHHDLRPN